MKEETVKGVIDIDSYLIMSTTIRSFNDVAVLTIVNEKLFYKDCENVKALKVLADHVSKMKTNKKLYGGLQFVEGHLANYGDDQIHVVFAVDERATNHIKNLPNYMQFYVNKWPGFTVTMEKNMRSNYGMTHFYKRTVKFSSYLHEKLDSEVLDANIAHELIHVYLWSIHSLDPASHDGEFIDWATELEARTPYKNLLTDLESDELIKLVRTQYNLRCRTCGQEKKPLPRHWQGASSIKVIYD
ncbi:unnamed protein product [Trichogramma brassicae]|uniref:SprT-like domain-containing protein n=1 Tax=Trichogramma brassicae TaxID=86971 RepID=A0A6H5IES1_9HYME|nr:unnamed protein product [Trichogramma brassicae]